ncbi:MAG: selenophosphate synthetase [Nonlabens sp.]
MKNILLTILLISLLISCKEDQNKDLESVDDSKEIVGTNAPQSLDYKVAKKAGIRQWPAVDTVKFTFVVSKNDDKLTERAWTWLPKTDKVTLKSKGETVVYNRNAKLDSLAKSTDRAFVNDVYWLLPQFKTQWDEGTEISFPNEQTMQLQYTGDGGYTPGDRYDFTVNENNQITSWDYYPAGADQPAMTTSFENYKTINGIRVAMDHKSPDGSLNIYFTDVDFIKG